MKSCMRVQVNSGDNVQCERSERMLTLRLRYENDTGLSVRRRRCGSAGCTNTDECNLGVQAVTAPMATARLETAHAKTYVAFTGTRTCAWCVPP